MPHFILRLTYGCSNFFHDRFYIRIELWNYTLVLLPYTRQRTIGTDTTHKQSDILLLLFIIIISLRFCVVWDVFRW